MRQAEFVIKNLSTKNSLDLDIFTGKVYQTYRE